MKFELNKASDIFNEKPFEIEIEIETLQDLEKLQKEYQFPLTIDIEQKIITILDYD